MKDLGSTGRQRRWWLPAIAGIAILVLVVVGWRRDSNGVPPATGASSSVPPARSDGRASARITGRVVASGRGADGAIVVIRGAKESFNRVIVADAQGRFVKELPPGRYELRASARGLAQATAVTVALGSGQTEEVTLSLVDVTSGVRGTIVDLESGVLVGARVEAVDLRMPVGAPLVAISDEHGAYQLALPAGAYVVTASFDGYVSATRRIAVTAGPRAENFRLAPGATIRGRVLRAADRAPIADACVRADVDTGDAAFLPGAAPPCVMSGADGSFELVGIAPGVATLTAAAAGWGQPAPVEVAVGIGEVRDGIELVLEPATTLVGHVVDRHGAPLDGVGVYAMRPEDLGRVAAWATSGDDGGFALEGLAAGHYVVRTVPDRLRLTAGSATVELPTHEPLTLRIDAGATISGRVSPARPGRVHVRPRIDNLALDGLATATATESLLSAEIDDGGRFTLIGVPAGAWELLASTADGGGAATVTVADREISDVVIALDQLASVCGVVREVDGLPLGDVTVTPTLRGQPTSPPATIYGLLQHAAAHRGTPVAEDGSFCVTDLTPGDYLLVVRDERQALMWSRRHVDDQGNIGGVSLAPGERRTGFVLEVHRPMVALRGRVVDESGAPVADALVTVDRDGTVTGDAADHFPALSQMDPAPPVVSDATGAFAVDVLPAPHRVTAEVPARGLRGTVVVADPSQPAVVRVERSGALHGTAHGGDGTCRVAVRGVRTSATIGTGADCAFAFEHLPAGHYTVSVRRGEAIGEASVDVVPGGTATCAVALSALATVELRLVGNDGSGRGGLVPLIIGGDTDSARSMLLETLAGTHPRTDRDGRATLHAPAGDATLGVLSGDGQRVVLAKPVTIAAPVTDLGTQTVP